MSTTRVVVERNVREKLHDTKPSNPVLASQYLWDLIAAHAQIISNSVWQGVTESAAAITYIVGTSDYALSSSVEYAQIIGLRRDNDSVPLARVSPATMDNLRANATSAGTYPEVFSLLESTTQALTVRLWPTPGVAGTATVVRTALVGALASDAAVIPFSQPLTRALEMRIAAEAVSCMSQAQADELGLDKQGAPQFWMGLAASAIKDEKDRIASLKQAGYIVPVEGW